MTFVTAMTDTGEDGQVGITYQQYLSSMPLRTFGGDTDLPKHQDVYHG